MKHIIPFSNGSEEQTWLFYNCDSCKTKSNCFARRNIEYDGYIRGTITLKAAEFIGMTDGSLNANCAFKNKRDIKKPAKSNSLQSLPLL